MTDQDRKRPPRGHKKQDAAPASQPDVDDLATFAYESLLSGRFEDAEESLKKALALVDPANLASRAVLFTYFGQSLRLLQKFEEGQASLSQAIELARKASLLACELQARLFLAEMLKDSGQMNESARQFDAAFQAATFLKDDNATEIAAGNLGSIYLTLCQFELASDWFTTALTVAQDTNSQNVSLWLGSLGLTMSELGQFEKSIDWYRRAYLQAELAGDKLTMSICRGSEGNVRFEQKQYEHACQLYKEAKCLAQPVDRRREGIWLGNLGVALSRLGDLEQAAVNIGEAIELARSLNDRQSLAAHLDSLGDCYKSLGEQDKATASYEQALEIARNIKDHLGERIYLSNLGRLKADAGELTPAFEYFASACNLFDEQRSSIKSDDLKTSFANKGQELYRDVIATCLKLGKRVEALEYVGRAKSRALLDLLSNSPIDVSDLAAVAESQSIESQSNDMQSSQSHSRENQSAESLALKQLVNREAALRSQITQLERLYWQGDSQNSDSGSGNDNDAGGANTRGATLPQEDSTRLYGEWRDVLNQLRRRHPNYASLISASTLTFAQMQDIWKEGILSDDTCLIEFYFPKEYLLVSAITAPQSSTNIALNTSGDTIANAAASGPINHVILDEEILETLRADLAAFLEMSSTEGWEVPASLCKRLYNKLLAPLLKDLSPNIKRLILVPHAALYHLPFSALHDGTGYLCERYSISYVPTVSLIPILAKQKGRGLAEDSAQRLALGLGAGGELGGGASQALPGAGSYLISAISDYSATRSNGMVFSSRLRSAAGLEDLGYTMEEAQSIATLGQGTAGSTALITNEQVKESLPKMFGDYEVVHFAGHAVFNADEPMASGLVLADGTILSAASILEGSALRTRRGRLLVLSACQTGVNVVTDGGEILGLARALMYAGMPNLVLSLWEVADRSTADLMQDFHRFLQSSLQGAALLGSAGAAAGQSQKTTIAEALRQAQLKAIAAKHPIHAWAPFIHFGVE